MIQNKCKIDFEEGVQDVPFPLSTHAAVQLSLPIIAPAMQSHAMKYLGTCGMHFI